MPSSTFKTCPTCGLQVNPAAKTCPRDGTNLLYAQPVEAMLTCAVCKQQYAPPLTHCPTDNVLLKTAENKAIGRETAAVGTELGKEYRPVDEGSREVSAQNKGEVPQSQKEFAESQASSQTGTAAAVKPNLAPTLLTGELPRISREMLEKRKIDKNFNRGEDRTVVTSGTRSQIEERRGASGVTAETTHNLQTPARKACPKCGLQVEPSVQICPRDGTDLNPVNADPIFSGKYQFIESVGAGGMGVIYKAKHLAWNKIVAIKMMHSHLQSLEAIKRFQIEAKAASILSHSNIVAVHDIGTTSAGQPYMIMDFVEGETLSQIITRETRVTGRRFYDIFHQVCEALAHAHKRKVLHRDIKPSNIMITQTMEGETAKIMDFGIAKLLDDTDSGAQHLTKTGDAIGSPVYMSPEQARAIKLDQRSDLYSLGCVMYECLTGTPPFQGNTALDTMLSHMNDAPLPMKQASLGSEVDANLEKLVMRLLEKDPDRRYQSMSELDADLHLLEEAQAHGKTVQLARPTTVSVKKENWSGLVKIGLLAGGAAVVLAAPLVMLWHSQPRAEEVHIKNAFVTTTALPPAIDTWNAVAEKDKNSDLHSMINQPQIELSTFILRREQVEKPVHDVDLMPLKDAKVATGVVITDARVTDKVIDYLQGLKHLNHLDLAGTDVSKLNGVSNFDSLTYLSVKGTKLTSEGVKEIRKLKSLRVLDLGYTAITPGDLKILTGMPTLRAINLRGCSFLNQGDIRDFRARNPGVLVQLKPAPKQNIAI